MAAAAKTPGATLIRNSQCQDQVSVIHPPTTGPTVGASTATISASVVASGCRRSGNSKNTAEKTAGISAPPAKPCSTRNEISVEKLSDSANLGIYGGGNDWPSINGGSGFCWWMPLSDTGGGGTYMEGVNANNRQITGSSSFALYAGSGSYDISRPLSSAITVGSFSILTRFDSGRQWPESHQPSCREQYEWFWPGELLSFGLVNGNELTYTDGSGFHTLSSGEARGDIWDWTVNFNAAQGTYSLSVAEVGGGYSTTVSGNLEETGTSVDSFAVINSSTGGNQNLIFDLPTFEVPEPSSLALALAPSALSSFFRAGANDRLRLTQFSRPAVCGPFLSISPAQVLRS